MTRLRERYRQEVAPQLLDQLGYRNVHQLPRLAKVVLNVGLSANAKDQKLVETAADTLQRVTGQVPVKTLAKQSISNFKIRQGQTVGMKVTLRGERMESFVDKLIHVTFPRVRDFRGLDPQAVDGMGNLTVGLTENLAFPEISGQDVDHLHGVEVTVVTTAESRGEGLALLKAFGFPFRQP